MKQSEQIAGWRDITCFLFVETWYTQIFKPIFDLRLWYDEEWWKNQIAEDNFNIMKTLFYISLILYHSGGVLSGSLSI